jgi:uncharacterized protein YvpB
MPDESAKTTIAASGKRLLRTSKIFSIVLVAFLAILIDVWIIKTHVDDTTKQEPLGVLELGEAQRAEATAFADTGLGAQNAEGVGTYRESPSSSDSGGGASASSDLSGDDEEGGEGSGGGSGSDPGSGSRSGSGSGSGSNAGAGGESADDSNTDRSKNTRTTGAWQTLDGERSYVYSNGEKATGTVLIDGATVSFDENGVWLSTRLDVPYVSQLPDMPFGCEVVSATMMLNHAGVSVTKEELVAGLSYSPDPNQGFTGSITYAARNGLGGIVWPQGILPLVQGYKSSALDLSGSTWETIQGYLDSGRAVCMWITVPTILDHTVVLTGYSKNEVWINDPQVDKDVAMNLALFQSYWQSNGQRALSY